MAESGWKGCVEDEGYAFTHNYLLSPLCFIGSIVMLLILYKYMAAKLKEELEISGAAFYIPLLLFLCCFGNLLSSGLVFTFMCRPGYLTAYMVCYQIYTLCYVLVYFLLIVILFNRLQQIFSGSILEISMKSVRIFQCVYASTICLGVVSAVCFVRFQSYLVLILLVVTATLVMSLIGYLCVAFISKLYAHYKTMATRSDSDESCVELIDTISKTSMLAVIALTCSLISCVMICANGVFNNDWRASALAAFFIFLDASINSICIFLTFKQFNRHFEIFCGCCKRQWTRLWKQQKLSSSTSVMSVSSGVNLDLEKNDVETTVTV